MNVNEAHIIANDRARTFVIAAHLLEFGMSAEAVAMATDMLTSLQMQAWHEGAIAALDAAFEKVEASKR